MKVPVARITSALLENGFTWLRQAGRSLRQVWLESTGALFICMGLLALPSAWKEWHSYTQGGPLWRLLVAALFMCLTIGFGIASFKKARRIR